MTEPSEPSAEMVESNIAELFVATLIDPTSPKGKSATTAMRRFLAASRVEGRREVIEECAKIAEAYEISLTTIRVAEHIRALAEPTAQTASAEASADHAATAVLPEADRDRG